MQIIELFGYYAIFMPKIIYFISFDSKMQLLDYFDFMQYLHA